MKHYDVLIVGGGAAGFFSAINTAQRNSDLKIAILERGNTVLSKVKISGGGRCNVTHAEFEPKPLSLHYPRGQKELLGPFHTFMTGDTMEWFEKRGVDFIKIMTKLDLVIPAFILLFLSTWVTNSLNLFSAALAFATIKTKWSYKRLTLYTSVLGVFIALLGITEHFFVFLNALGVLIPSVSSIYIAHFVWIKKQVYQIGDVQDWSFSALISWSVASVISFCTYMELFHLTQAYFVDSFLIGGILYFVLNIKRFSKYKDEKNN